MSRLTLLTLGLCASMATACSSPVNPTSTSVMDRVPSSLLPNGFEELAASNGGGNARLAPVRQATAAYHDVTKAIADGYAPPQADECVASPAGGMGVHAVNPALLSDQVIDPLRPEVLLYEPKKNGGFKLVGVEYVQTVLVRNKTTGAVSPWFAPTPWPAAEYDVVTPPPSVLGQSFDGPMPGHEPGTPWHFDLHVWAWAPNPSGDFAPFNPRVSCDGAQD